MRNSSEAFITVGKRDNELVICYYQFCTIIKFATWTKCYIQSLLCLSEKERRKKDHNLIKTASLARQGKGEKNQNPRIAHNFGKERLMYYTVTKGLLNDRLVLSHSLIIRLLIRKLKKYMNR